VNGTLAAAPPMRMVRSDFAVAVAIVGILALTIMPLPPFLLDLLLALSLCTAVLTFLISMYIDRPLDFSSFPSLLLFVTLFRLALNVASTRLVLLRGGEGRDAAGGVIRSFGELATGGNYVVGGVVFIILVIVNFIVITKGAERISEVSARFTLDSLPGKQMAIDADLGAGLINEREARERRAEVEREADFHGAMDGASKFVRGDAIAGILITFINIIGGLIIGVAQQGLSIGEAATTYTILTIGDGLVSQIPALLVSTGAALLVTRTADGVSLGDSLGTQLFSRKKPMTIAAVALGAVGLVPGMPHVAFFALAGASWYAARRAARAEAAKFAGTERPGERPSQPPDDPEAQKAEIAGLLPVDLLGLDVGLDLLPMVDVTRGGELLGRIAAVRKQMATELGLIVPPVHVRDDLTLRPGGYRVIISGVAVAKGEVRVGRLLAIDPTGSAAAEIGGERVREPTFGLPAKWIAQSDRPRAEALGCTVVDASAVLATHITEMIRRNGHELLGRREAQELIDLCAKQDAKVVEELIPHHLALGDVIQVMRNLLREGVSIRDMRTILETLADHAAQVKDPGELTELVRQRLSRRITAANLTDKGELRALALDPRAEELFREGGRREASAGQTLTKLTRSLERAVQASIQRDEPALLVVAPDVRRAVAAVAERHVPGLAVMSYREIDAAVPFVTSGVVAAEGG
jgi:flagellar biosynthesis protein FlhA